MILISQILIIRFWLDINTNLNRLLVLSRSLYFNLTNHDQTKFCISTESNKVTISRKLNCKETLVFNLSIIEFVFQVITLSLVHLNTCIAIVYCKMRQSGHKCYSSMEPIRLYIGVMLDLIQLNLN